MKLKMITPDTILFDGNTKRIHVAEPEGTFSILDRHAPLLMVVKHFVLTLLTETDELTYIAAGAGVLKVLNNEVSLIVDYGAVGASKEQAKTNLAHLKEEIIQRRTHLGDDTIANLELELMRMTQNL